MSKFFLAVAVATALAACGGQQEGYQEQPASKRSASNQLESLAPYITVGERKTYEISSGNGSVSATSKDSAVADFRTQSTDIRFRDITVSFDKDGPTGQIYRLYKAAFGRAADVRGLGYWRAAMLNNGLSLSQIAFEFLESKESKLLYGTSSSDEDFVNKLYNNVLGRTPDALGAAYWLGILKGGTSRVSVLLSFADSAENKSTTSAVTPNGIAYAEPGIAYLPVAEASGPINVTSKIQFQVDASASSDANDDIISYYWTFVSQPVGSAPWMSSRAAKIPNVILDKAGTYQLQLVATDTTAPSFTPARITINVHEMKVDTGTYRCAALTSALVETLYTTGYTFLDRDADGVPCTAADIAIERQSSASLPDTGIYKCSTISHQLAVQLYQQGHKYLDRDNDGKPCEATDLVVEQPYVPPVVTPPSVGRCWVNGYYRKNGTYVRGYWRSC